MPIVTEEQRHIRASLASKSRSFRPLPAISAAASSPRSRRPPRCKSPPLRNTSPIRCRVQALNRAQAVFYDDKAENLVGAPSRGTTPAIRTVHCKDQPLTHWQLEDALSMSCLAGEQQVRRAPPIATECAIDCLLRHSLRAGMQVADPEAPALLFFFDFDMTLSLQVLAHPMAT